jgi:hypothetical protein
MTPLEATQTPMFLMDSSAALLTAGGKNPDVLAAFRSIVAHEPRRFLVMCASSGSPLAKLASSYSYVDVTEVDLPSGKDGFLATNSLLASCVLLLRAYGHAFGQESALTVGLTAILESVQSDEDRSLDLSSLWQRPVLTVLHGPSTFPAAFDLESKFTEAALGSVQLADYRNFAHGRHHWLAKRGDQTVVLAFITERDREVAEKTLAALPSSIPVARIEVPFDGALAALAAIVRVFKVVKSAGEATGIDPGDPGVPPFGRQIYHLRAYGKEATTIEDAAIERKSGTTLSLLKSQNSLEEWKAAYQRFVTSFANATFGGVVFDYDGTLCDEDHRFEPLNSRMASALNALLTDGVVIGVATGRGKSVKESLRKAIDKTQWHRVIVGYYNGGDIASLDDNDRPDGTDCVHQALEPFAAILRTDRDLSRLARLTFRTPQITIEPNLKIHADRLWRLLQHLLFTLEVPGVVALRSSHSMDVLAPSVSKRAVVERVMNMVRAKTSVLCIGDRGLWPGNDFALLSNPYSLSVDEVSPDPATCWNLAEPGRRGMDATLDYLSRLQKKDRGHQMRFI